MFQVIVCHFMRFSGVCVSYTHLKCSPLDATKSIIIIIRMKLSHSEQVCDSKIAPVSPVRPCRRGWLVRETPWKSRRPYNTSRPCYFYSSCHPSGFNRLGWAHSHRSRRIRLLLLSVLITPLYIPRKHRGARIF